MSRIGERHEASDPAAFKAAFGRFATGVSVATCAAPDEPPLGVTINALASVSLDPPMALFCLEERAASLSSFLRAGHFALNFLAGDQAPLSAHFARQHTLTEEHSSEIWVSGAPILTHALAVADCALLDTYGGGDHVILLGRVQSVGWRDDADPLVYYHGGYGVFRGA